MISVVDDDESVCGSIRGLLRSVGYRVISFASAESLLASDTLRETACLVLDVWMPGMNGLELQGRLKETGACIPIVFVTAHDEAWVRERALAVGAVDMLHKPFAASALLAAVRKALGDSELPQEEEKFTAQ